MIEKLFEMYDERQLGLATQILGGDKATAADVCQKARQIVLRRSLESKKSINAFWPFLRRVTINACYKELRQRRQEQARLRRVADRYVIAEAVDPAIAAMLADVRLTSERLVYKHFGSLSLAMFRLRYVNGLSSREIADRLGISVSTVKRRHREIIVLLRRSLA